MSVPTPETRQGNSPDSPQVLSCKEDNYQAGNPLHCSGTPSLPPWLGFPPDGYQEAGWGLVDDANLFFCCFCF